VAIHFYFAQKVKSAEVSVSEKALRSVFRMPRVYTMLVGFGSKRVGTPSSSISGRGLSHVLVFIFSQRSVIRKLGCTRVRS